MFLTQKRVTNQADLAVVLRERSDFPKTCIMGTIGPKCFSPEHHVNLVPDMISAGMNMVRINLAHVNTNQQKETVVALLEELQQYISRSGELVVVTADLAGPKIRVAERLRYHSTQGEELTYLPLKTGQVVRLTLDEEFGVTEGTWGQIDTKISILTGDTELNLNMLKPGSRVSMDDGCVRLLVDHVDGCDVVCKVMNDWDLAPRKGVNFPGSPITASALTGKDFADLDWLFSYPNGVARGKIDYLSMSFVKSKSDVDILRNYLAARWNCPGIRIIAKIETAEAVADPHNDYPVFREILEASDGIMIARGDLGAEVPFEDVPEIQLQLIQLTHEARKPVIVATQMLEFMVEHEFATRAEVTDVTNAILEGADVTMLSGETSKGINPVSAVQTMRQIAKRACARVSPLAILPGDQPLSRVRKIIDAMAHPIVEFADRLDAARIVCISHSGDTPIAIARYRPRQPVFGVTYNVEAAARMAPYRGIYVVYINYVPKDPAEHRDACRRILENELGIAKLGELSVVAMSMGDEEPDRRETNALYVLRH